LMAILLHYYITYRCNARCTFCDIWYRPDYRGIPDAGGEDVLRNLQDARRLGARFVDFTGGEPLLVAELPRWLSMARRLGYWTSVTTNCILYPRRARELRGLVDLLHFSLDAVSPEIHDRLRGVPCHRKVMESIEIALDLGERPDILFTATRENVDQIESLVRLAQRYRLMLIINPEFPYFGRPGLSAESLENLVAWAREPYVYINRAMVEMFARGGNDPANPRCKAVSSTIIISPDNKLLLPCFHHKTTEIDIGTNLEKAVNHPSRREMLALQGRLPQCRGCTVSCYFDPSFLYRLDKLFFLSLFSKAKYGYDKYIRPLLVPGPPAGREKGPGRPKPKEER